jgi:uncharacterized membrane protein YgdD (TMEM256/DUF423 family)
MIRVFLLMGALFAGSAVAAGAFGAHALRGTVTARSLEIFETANRYQMYHAIALLFIALLRHQMPSAASLLSSAGAAFIAGIVLFSGSLYGLSLTDIKTLGIITPLGGLAFIVGWICLAIASWNFKSL